MHNMGVAKTSMTDDEVMYGGGDSAVVIGRYSASDSHGTKLFDGK